MHGKTMADRISRCDISCNLPWQRGQDIFLTDDDREMFLGLLEVLSERFTIEIYAYVLMGNHYHVLLGIYRRKSKCLGRR